MREWHLTASDPRSLTIAADARLCTPDYADDQVWELFLGEGEPPALALQTTYGLRARSMRLFPRFIEGDVYRSNPADFAIPPAVTCFYPNYLSVSFSPLADLEVKAEYWVPASHAVAGRIQIANRGANPRQVRLEWIALLIPGGVDKTDKDQPMAPLEIQAVQVLAGRSRTLAPVVFMTGGSAATSGSYPALVQKVDLATGEVRQVFWSQAALSEHTQSFELVRQIAARNWEAESARIEMLNAGQVAIYTGDTAWDAAFALSQKVAGSLFIGPSDHLPCPSILQARQPDQGYSMRGDGSDYGYLWDGQTPLEAYILIDLILPSSPSLAEGLLDNFLSTQAQDGSVDWKPGLAGQRGNCISTPLLASLAWRIYQVTENRLFLQKVFTQLVKYLHAWFDALHDRDEDGLPEWDHSMQAGFDDHPLFDRWHEWAQGVDIETVESPSLCAFLYQETQVMIRISQILEEISEVENLQAWSDRLKSAVNASWDENMSAYRYWDRDTHDTPSGEVIYSEQGSGEIKFEREFSRPTRLQIKVKGGSEATRRMQVFIHGVGPSGTHRIEHIPANRFHWNPGWGTVTTERTYTSLERVEVQGLTTDDRVTFYCVDLTFQDHTLLLPLWAGIPDTERARALVEKNITAVERFWRPYGLPACSANEKTPAEICHNVCIPWNILIGHGLVEYGYRTVAAELLTRLMTAITRSLKSSGAFRQYYHAETGQGIGERNTLDGLAPVGLFLEVLGVRLVSPFRVMITGFNPFPWPVTVKYRGLAVLCQKDKTLVIFPDGQTVSVSEPVPRIIALE